MSRSSNRLSWAQSLDNDFDLIGSSLGTKRSQSKNGARTDGGIKQISDNISVSSYRPNQNLQREQYNSDMGNMPQIRTSTPSRFSINRPSSFQSRTSFLPNRMTQVSINSYSKPSNNFRTSEYSFNSNFGGNSVFKETQPTSQVIDTGQTTKKSLTHFLGLTRPAFELPTETENLKTTNLSRTALDNLNYQMGTFPRAKEAPYDDTISTQGRLANAQQDIPIMLKTLQARTSPRRTAYTANDSVDSHNFSERYKRNTHLDPKHTNYADYLSTKRGINDYKGFKNTGYNAAEPNSASRDKFRIFKGSDIISEYSANNIGRNTHENTNTKRYSHPTENNYTFKPDSQYIRSHQKSFDNNDKRREDIRRIEIMQNQISQLKKELEDAQREIKLKDLNIQQLEKQLYTNSDIRHSNRNSYTEEFLEPNHYLEQYIPNTQYSTTSVNKEKILAKTSTKTFDLMNNLEISNPNLTRLKTLLESARKREKVFDNIYQNETENNKLIMDDTDDNKKKVVFMEDQVTSNAVNNLEQGIPRTTSNIPSDQSRINNDKTVSIEETHDSDDPYIDFTGRTTNTFSTLNQEVSQLNFPLETDVVSTSNQPRANRKAQPRNINGYDSFDSQRTKIQNQGSSYPVFPTEYLSVVDSNDLKSKSQKNKTIDNNSFSSSPSFSSSSHKNKSFDNTNDPFNRPTIDQDPFAKNSVSSPPFPSGLSSNEKAISHNKICQETYDNSFLETESVFTLNDNLKSKETNPMKTETVDLKSRDDNQNEDSCGSKSTESTTINVFVESNNEETNAEESPTSNLEENPDMTLIFSKKSLLNEINPNTEFKEDVLDVKFFEVAYDSK